MGEVTVTSTSLAGRLIPLADIYGVDDSRELAWMDYAACAEVGGDLHFPEKGGSVRQAKQVCRACEVRAECLDYALRTAQVFGIWGGMSAPERYALRRRQQASPVPQPSKEAALCTSLPPQATPQHRGTPATVLPLSRRS